MSGEDNESNERLVENPPQEGENQPANGEIVPAEPTEGERNAVAEAEQQRQQNKGTWGESFFAVTKSLIIRALIIYFISSFFRRPQTEAPTTPGPGGAPMPKLNSANLFENGTIFDLNIYLSESKIFTDFGDPNAHVWTENELIYGDWTSGPENDGTRVHIHKFNPSEQLKNNGSIYLHVFITKSGKSPDPNSGKEKYAGKDMVSHARMMVNKFKKVRYQKTHNLLTGETTATEEEIKKAELMNQEIISHWHPNMTINLVVDQTNWVPGQVPPPLNDYIHFSQAGSFYKPVIYFNDFWNMQRDYQPINDTVKELELRLTYQPLSLFKWQIYTAQNMRNKWTSSLLGSAEEEESDQDTLKEALLETNAYLLGLTFAVSILHSIFEFLAFKNDIEFWNNRKSLEGLSVRSVFFNVFQSLIVLLYVLDNETNTVVRISCAIGLCIEIWKINKTVDIKVNRESKIFGIFPRISVHDKGSYVESSTKMYDRLAFKYLSWALFPLLGGYAVYSLMYLEHKSWYSWVLSMLYGFLLTFGFIMMTPQLFINYKLKSVAHLPWRMLSYKFLNTFIDDVFAFVIKMPTLYRLGCFRDDIVFCIFLYQRWIYKTDLSRVNEFGFSGEMEAKLKEKKEKKEGPKAIEPAKDDAPKVEPTKDTVAKKTD
ncbi:cleft lip and palate transmembrane protein 1 homolog [Belonocnema kinseyi]|uniref:cleft lip and palate transmembrane protein 1 homolog n=1 Tax=Belonocnema kinseyi TaxID=2817044 RepID=UPI00143DFD66|nr:cleft lip and palate transmembrane protein 1 homolog [Belonocnema kinseyi]